MQRVFNFSGGKTSAFMTIINYRVGDIVLFCDTGREHEKTYKFIRDFEFNEGIPVTWLRYDGGWTKMLYKWNKGRNIPNRTQRQCTDELKIKTARRHMRGLGFMRYENFIGFRSDEQLRIKKHEKKGEKWKQVKTVFPLNEMGVTKKDIENYWENKKYTLEITSILGNCDMCFLKGENSIIAIMQHYPELADKWISDEEEAAKSFGHTYIKGTTYKAMLEASKLLIKKKYSLEELQPKFNCSCTA